MKITISGLPGSGKGTLRKNLAKKLGYNHIKSVGDLQGEIAIKKGITIPQLMKMAKTDSSIHTEMDEKIAKYGETHSDLIVEGWIAYNFIPDSIKIFLDVEKNIAAERIYKDNKNRPDEPQYSSIDEALRSTQDRLQNTWGGFKKAHGIDFLDKNNYDIVIDTSDKDPEKVFTLAERKIRDYNQLMFPPQFYLGHSSKSKKEVRRWELNFEKETGIKLENPFFDCNTEETEMGHLNEEKYLILGEQVSQLARGDLEKLADRKTIGGIFVIDKNFTMGTYAEWATTRLMGKLVYSLVTHPEEVYQKHPFVMLFSDKIFPTKNSLTRYIKQNKKNLFRDLEQSRQRTLNDHTFQVIYEQIFKNIKNVALGSEELQKFYGKYVKL